MSRYEFIQGCSQPWPVHLLGRLLAVSAAGCYQWRQRPAAVPARWHTAAQEAFTHHAGRYGPLRLSTPKTTRWAATRCWWYRHGLRSLSTRLQCPRTAVADPATVVAENRLLGRPPPHLQILLTSS